MNNFQLTGYVRQLPQSTMIGLKVYVCIIISQNGGSTNIPVYFTGKICSKVLKLKIGTEVEVTGRLESLLDFNENVGLVTLYPVAENFQKIGVYELKFSKNLVLKTVLGQIETEDLLKKLKEVNKKKGNKK